MIKHIEVKTYTYGNINVTVSINYDDKHISLVEKTNQFFEGGMKFEKKNYIFAKRGLEYMNGWRNILEGIKYAIDEAEKELQDYLTMKEKEKHDDVTAILMEATGIVKKRNAPKKKK